MEIDQPAVPGPAENDNSKASTVKSLLESRDHKALARRENKDALRALCQDRGLDNTLCKIELAKQLITWVSVSLSVMSEQRFNVCSAIPTNLVVTSSNPSGNLEAFSGRTSSRKYGMI